MRGGAVGAIVWFELALFGAVLVATPIMVFGAALACPAGADCGPGQALAGMVATAVGVGGAFLVAVVALDRAAGRWHPIALAEFLTGVALVSATVAVAIWTVVDGDAVVPLVALVGLLCVPGIGLAEAGRTNVRRRR